MSTQCGASMRIGKGTPNSDANELSGASVPEVSTTARAPPGPARSPNANAGLSAHRESVVVADRSSASPKPPPADSANVRCTTSLKSLAPPPPTPPRAYLAEVKSISAVLSAAPPTRLDGGVFESFASFTAALRASSIDANLAGSSPMSRICRATRAPSDHTAIHRSKPSARSGHRGCDRSEAPPSQRATPSKTLARRAFPTKFEAFGFESESGFEAFGFERSRWFSSSKLATRRNSSAAATTSESATSQLAASLATSSTLCASSRITRAPFTSTSMAARTDGSRR